MKEFFFKLAHALEGGYGWITELVAFLALVILINVVLKWILLKLSAHFKKNGDFWKDSFITAVIPPLTSLVWLIAAAQAINYIYMRLTDQPLIVTSYAIIKIGLILAFAWFFLRWKRLLFIQFQEHALSKALPFDIRKTDAINKVLTLAIYLIAALMLLEQTGSSMNTLIAFGGISGLAIAFASQQIIANFFGGIMIYLNNPFEVGDWIHLPEKNIEGVVEEIGWYTTEVRGFDKRPIYIPNSMLTNVMVSNPSRMTHRRFKEVIGLRYQDISRLPAIIQDLEAFFHAHPKIDQSLPPQVHFEALGTHSVDIQIIAYIASKDKGDYQNIAQDILFGIVKIVDKNEADFATPVTAIELRKGFPFDK